MSYHTWHNYGYGICTDKLETAEVSRIQTLIRCAPEYEKVINKLLQERGITEPTTDDYLELEINGPYGMASILSTMRHLTISWRRHQGSWTQSGALTAQTLCRRTFADCQKTWSRSSGVALECRNTSTRGVWRWPRSWSMRPCGGRSTNCSAT